MGRKKNRKAVRRIKKQGISVSVFGLGHVGAAVAAACIRAGFAVVGADISREVVSNAAKGKTHVMEPEVQQAFRNGLKTKRFSATTDLTQASKITQVKIVTVPVGITNGSPNLSAMEDVSKEIAKGLKKGDLVSVNSSVPIGTTEDLVLPILEGESGLKGEKDFFLVYSPERVYEGRAVKDIEENYPIIVSGIGARSMKAGSVFYARLAKKGVIQVSSVKAAEAEKLIEGVYRDVNIALANELARICEKTGINFWEVRKAANSQPFCHLHKPSTGVGGACIPIYPLFLIETADKNKIASDMVKLGRTINTSMPKYCVEAGMELLQKAGKTIKDANIAVLGLAFRGGVDDTRLSPSYDVINELVKAGCNVRVHDPFVHKNSNLPPSVTLTNKLEEAVKDADLIIVSTDHRQYQSLSKKKLSQHSGALAVYDGRGILDKNKFKDAIFAGVGRP